MSFLVIGDLHLRLANLETAKVFFEFVDTQIKSKKVVGVKPPTIVFLGDIYEVKSLLRAEIQNFLYEKLSQIINDHKSNIVIVLGNHDYTNLNLVDHSFAFLNTFKGTVKESIRVVAAPYHDVEGKVAYHPFTNDYKAFKEFALGLGADVTLFCHQAINGFYYSRASGITEQNAVDIEGIKCKIVAGHFHSYQNNGNVTYLGTPFSTSFSEANEVKNIMFKDPTGEYLIPVIDDKIPRHLIIKTDLEKLLSGKGFEYTQNDFVRFEVVDNDENCNQASRALILKLMEEGRLPQCPKFYIQYERIDLKTEVAIEEDSSFQKMFDDYVNMYFKEHSEKALIVNLGNKILKEMVQ